MSEPFIEKHAISIKLSNVNQESVCRRDREPSGILILSLKRLGNKSRRDKPIIA